MVGFGPYGFAFGCGFGVVGVSIINQRRIERSENQTLNKRVSVLLFTLCFVALAWYFLSFKEDTPLTTEVVCISPTQTFRVQANPGTSLWSLVKKWRNSAGTSTREAYQLLTWP